MPDNNGTRFEFQSAGKTAPRGDLLIVPLFSSPKPALPTLAAVDALCDSAVSTLARAGALSGEPLSLAQSATSGAFRRVLTVNLGDLKTAAAAHLREAAGRAARWAQTERIRTASLWIDALVSCPIEKAVAEWALGMALAGFRFQEHKAPQPQAVERVRVTLQASEAAHVAARIKAVPAALALAEAVNYARRLAHQPANVINPSTLAAEARSLAKAPRLKCTVLNAAEARRLGMNGLLAVGAASEHAPCLIRLDYRGAPRAARNTVLVGKAVTFDTGGYSIKPAAGLERMKFDKCGGMTVLGIMKAAATLKLPCNLVGLVAAAENAISSKAYRPGDILRMMSGKTVEVTNTDAEGRLVLADALWYAQKKCAPTAMIDFATLTGGVVTALGRHAAGLMCDHEELSAALRESGRATHERLWPLPLWDEYRELIKGADSDIKNSSGKRDAHAIVGGVFLKEFVEPGVPWAHIDIAGTATNDNNEATGFGVRLMVDYLTRR